MDSIINNDKWYKNEEIGIICRTGLDIQTVLSNSVQDELFSLEDDSWWFEYRAKVILTCLDKFFSKKAILIDVGGGNGYSALSMNRNGYNSVLMEPSLEACMNAKRRGLNEIYCGTLDSTSVIDSSIPQIMLLDVLEHIKDDREFMALMYNKMMPKGKILITVPAFMSLWSKQDVTSGHFRRYKLKDIVSLAESSGFSVLYKNYFMSFLYLPILVVRVWLEGAGILKSYEERDEEEKKRVIEQEHGNKTGIANKILEFIQQRELSKFNKKDIKIGSSCILVLEKH